MATLHHPGRACPICGSTECEPLHEQRFILPEGHPLGDRYTVVSCSACAFVYADTSVDQKKFDAFYADCSKYEDNCTGTGGGVNKWDQNRLRETAVEIERVIDQDARVLDVGCANGGLLAELRDLGFERLAGLDPSPVCARNTAALGFTAAQGSLAAIPAHLGTFDCIVLSHVLEHLFDLRAAVDALDRRLAPGGLLYTEVPDAARYHEFLVAPFQDFNTEHINHFSAGCLDNLLGAFGYRNVGGGQKDIASSSDSLTPAVFGFYRRSGDLRTIEPDRSLRERILAYIAGSRELLCEIDTHLGRSLDRGESVIIWGTGQLTMKLLCESVLANHDVVAFVDSNPINQGKVLRGVRVLSPGQLVDSAMKQPIVVGSLLHGKDIVADIRAKYGLENRLIDLRS